MRLSALPHSFLIGSEREPDVDANVSVKISMIRRTDVSAQVKFKWYLTLYKTNASMNMSVVAKVQA
jgi:hypothetical protein